ncbi:hypothetical protein [Chryseobacterium sp. 52]|uniref:hypothetical protein n=1 Tax=Chryseobacterium sp. 52 TaxID=2035213 RepID=UPI001E336948|nr:hypothetical protein [Chryseobacterium sp. 52]
MFLSIPRFEGPLTVKLNKGSLVSIAVRMRKVAKRQLLNLCFVLTVTRKNARNREMNREITVTIINKLILSIHDFLLVL